MNSRTPIDSRALLEQVNWVRALARRLVDDRHEAEDIAQDALVVALGSGGREPRVLRRWLGGIVRNLTRDARRRKSRERVATPPEPAPFPSALELVERAGMQRALVGAVLELPEADREVVLLRYVQGLSNEDMARALGIPASTAASRLSRALAKLEAKWRARHGEDGEAMLAVLAGLAPTAGGGKPAGTARGRSSHGIRRPSPRQALGTMSIATATRIAVTVAAGALVLVGSAWRAGDESRAGAMSAVGATIPAPSETAFVTASAPGSTLVAFLRQERRPSQPEAPRATTTCPSPLAVPVPIHGRVLDLEGRPVAGLEVQRIAPLVSLPGEWAARGMSTDSRATSDEEGRFVLEVPAIGWVEPVTPDWAPVLASELGLARDGAESLLVVAPSAPLGGAVRDPDGRPLAGVTFLLTPIAPRLALPGVPAPMWMPVPARTESEENGTFLFPRAASGRARLTLNQEGYAPRTEVLELPLEGKGPLALVLEPSRVPRVRGFVRDAGGRPVAGAEVSLGQEIVTTEETGAFLVSFDPEHDHGREGALLRAAHPRHGSAQRTVALPGPEDPPEVELGLDVVLQPGTHELSGRVIDPHGAPVSGLEVFVLEDTPLGQVGAPGGGFWRRSLEEALGACPKRTSADGRFRLTGLAARDYRVQVLDPTRLVSLVTEPLGPDAAEMTLRFDPSATAPVAGRLVDGNGAPLEGVSVSVSLRRWWSGPEDLGFDLTIGASAVSDREGRFRLDDVAREGVFLRIEGAEVVPELFRDLDDERDRAALELVVGRRAELRIEWGEASARADRLHLEDARGRTLLFAEQSGTGVTPLEWLPVGQGSSPVLTIPAHATCGVLTRDGQDVERLPMRPVVGELVTLEP